MTPPESTGYRIASNALDVWLECPRNFCPHPRVFALRYPVTLKTLADLAEVHEASCHPDEPATYWGRGDTAGVEVLRA